MRQRESRRINGAALVLLVSLLVVAGAVLGVNYAATSSTKPAAASTAQSPKDSEPRVILERLPANAVIAPSSTAQPAPAPSQAVAIASTAIPQARPAAKAAAPAQTVGVIPELSESPWEKSTPSNRAPNTTPAPSKKRVNAKSIDTETPLIMD